MTARDVKHALRRRHTNAGDGAWVCVDEAFSGWATYTTGGIDLLAVGVWKTAKVPGLRACGKAGPVDTRNPIVAYEVKVSRADMRRELYGHTPGPNVKRRWVSELAPWPAKAQAALDRSHYFVFAVPAGMLTAEEIQRREPWPEGQKNRPLWVPEGAGLVEISGRGCTVRVHAAPRTPQPWTRHETHEIMRRVETTTRREAHRR